MSNSGRIGGKRKSASHRVVTQKAKIGECEGQVNRTHRRAYAAMARKNMDLLKEASTLAAKLHGGDVEVTKAWLYGENDGFSPIERILTGDGNLVIKQLQEMLDGQQEEA